MFIFMLFVVFSLVFFSSLAIVTIIDAVRNDKEVNMLPHAVIISACVTFLVFYFGR